MDIWGLILACFVIKTTVSSDTCQFYSSVAYTSVFKGSGISITILKIVSFVFNLYVYCVGK